SCPPSRTCSCDVECRSAICTISRPTELGTSCDFASSCAFASAIVPDFEMPPGVAYGSLTLVTCGTAASDFRSDATWVRTCASCIDGVPCIATCTVSPDSALKSACSRFDAFVDSVLGALKFVVKFGPIPDDSALKPTSATTHAPSTSQRLR